MISYHVISDHIQIHNSPLDAANNQGFGQPIITLTFDDGAEENIKTVLPTLEKHGFKSTHCYVTRSLQANAPNIDNIQTFHQAGHEICSHSVTHPALTKISHETLVHELKTSQAVLEDILGTPVPNFATPYGAYNPEVKAAIQNFYGVHRTIDEGFNTPQNLDLYALKAQMLKSDTSLAQFKGWVDQAIADQAWLILVYHRIGMTDLSAYDTHLDDFNEQMDYLAHSQVEVMRLDEAAKVVSGELGSSLE